MEDELADAVAKRERPAQRHQAKSDDQVRHHKEGHERLYVRVGALRGRVGHM